MGWFEWLSGEKTAGEGGPRSVGDEASLRSLEVRSGQPVQGPEQLHWEGSFLTGYFLERGP
jgi:hypothetical protein